MTPEAAKDWIDLALSYGPGGLLIFALVALRIFGYTISKAGKKKDGMNEDFKERRAPVNVECPMLPSLNAIETAMVQLVQQQSRLIEKQIEANTHLEHLVDLHLPPRERTGTHRRVRLEDIQPPPLREDE